MIRFPFSSLVFALLSSLYVYGDPVISTSQAQYDFGEKRTGEKVVHDFILENKGDSKLKITNIRSSCGCTTPGKTQMEIEAGASEILTVEMDLDGRSGPQTQHVTLSTNDPKHRSYSLKIFGEAIPDIRVEPRTLNLQQVDMDSPHQGELLLTSMNGETFEVTSVEANRNRVEAKVEMAEDGMSAKILVTPRPQKGQGHFTDVIEINTSHPDVEGVRVLVMWQISTGISVAPGQLKLVLGKENIKLDRYLMVRGYPGLEEPLAVTAVEWPGQEVEIAFSDTKKFGWRIHLKSFTPQKSMKDSEILIHTNAAGFETLKVPVRLMD